MIGKIKKILIAEDERAIAKAMELKLSGSGFEVRVARDGEEALEILSKEKFDLLLLDLVMPKVNGFGVLKGIKDKKIKIPVIVSSNLSQDEDFRKAKNMGAIDYYIKSNTPINNLVDNVKKILRK